MESKVVIKEEQLESPPGFTPKPEIRYGGAGASSPSVGTFDGGDQLDASIPIESSSLPTQNRINSLVQQGSSSVKTVDNCTNRTTGTTELPSHETLRLPARTRAPAPSTQAHGSDSQHRMGFSELLRIRNERDARMKEAAQMSNGRRPDRKLAACGSSKSHEKIIVRSGGEAEHPSSQYSFPTRQSDSVERVSTIVQPREKRPRTSDDSGTGESCFLAGAAPNEGRGSFLTIDGRLALKKLKELGSGSFFTPDNSLAVKKLEEFTTEFDLTRLSDLPLSTIHGEMAGSLCRMATWISLLADRDKAMDEELMTLREEAARQKESSEKSRAEVARVTQKLKAAYVTIETQKAERRRLGSLYEALSAEHEKEKVTGATFVATNRCNALGTELGKLALDEYRAGPAYKAELLSFANRFWDEILFDNSRRLRDAGVPEETVTMIESRLLESVLQEGAESTEATAEVKV